MLASIVGLQPTVLKQIFYEYHPFSRGSYGQKDMFSAMSSKTWQLIGHNSMMCKDQEYVKKYKYDLIIILVTC